MCDVKVGDRVITTVVVCGKQIKMGKGVVVWVSHNGTLCKVDIGSIRHGGRSVVYLEQCGNLIVSNES